MKTSMKVFSSSDAFTTLLTNVNNPFLLLFIGIGLTALLQSSSALTTILIAMVTAGLTIGRGPNDILYVVLGTNIGSCVTALLSSFGASTNGKRASLIHLMFNTFGSVIFFIVLLSKAIVNMLPNYKIRHTSPVAPSLTMRFRLPRNLALTSSGVRISLAFNPSCTSAYTDLPKMLLSHSFSGDSPVK